MLSDRLDRLVDYPFTRLRRLLDGVAPRTNAAPLVLSIGEPQNPPPAFALAELERNAHLWGKYPPVDGTPEYRSAAAAWLGRRYRLPAGRIDPERALIAVAGTKEALFLAAQLAVPETKAGRRPLVLMPNPAYAPYVGAAVMAGAEIGYLPATRATGFLPDLSAIAEADLARTALFYLCTPSNPEGAVADLAYLRQALALAREHDFVLAVDECYAEIYTDVPPTSALEAAGEDLDNLLVFHSLSKRSNGAGLRAGFVAGDPNLLAAFSRLRSFGAAVIPLPVQAAAAALWNDDGHAETVRAHYRSGFAVAEDALAGRFGARRPGGGFFLWLDVGDSERAAATLWREAALRVLPGAYLAEPARDGTNHAAPFIRVAVVHDAAIVGEACRRMAAVL